MSSIMKRLSYYWKHTAKEMEWQVAYRKCQTGTILKENKTSFSLLSLDKGAWAADPFVFKYDNEDYLFMELFLQSENKGVIACSKNHNGFFEKPLVVIEEPFHLSFPCIFEVENRIYMIPETASQKKVFLYECDQFPYKWHQKKVVLEGLIPSDVIVFENDDEYYAIVSILTDSACKAQNKLYKIDKISMEFSDYGVIADESEIGVRNAGMLFKTDGQIYRPGQNCENESYGKSLYFWSVDFHGKTYRETFRKEILITDIEKNKLFSGIHTYNSNENYEVVDYRIIKNTSFPARVKKMVSIICEYIVGKIRK